MSSKIRIPSHPEEQRRELERLQHELGSRASIVHFAHTAVSILFGLMLAGLSGKLLWDFGERPALGLGAGGLSVAALLYASVRYLQGKRCMAREAEHFASLQQLRRELRLDDPSALLPQQ